MLTTSGLAHLLKGLALLCCPGKVQGLLSQVLQLMGIKDSSPTLATTGSTLPPAPEVDGHGGGGQRGRWVMGQLFYAHNFGAGSPTPTLTGLALFLTMF